MLPSGRERGRLQRVERLAIAILESKPEYRTVLMRVRIEGDLVRGMFG